MTNPKPNLCLASRGDESEPSRQLIALAAIDQSHRDYRSPEPDVSSKGWTPIATDAVNPLAVDDVQRRSYKVIITDGRIPIWRRILKWLK